jgi:Tol biopolymer transport system component
LNVNWFLSLEDAKDKINAFSNGDIYVMNIDGTNQTPITGDPFALGFSKSSWSPDGSRLVCQGAHSFSPNTLTKIWVVFAGGGSSHNRRR